MSIVTTEEDLTAPITGNVRKDTSTPPDAQADSTLMVKLSSETTLIPSSHPVSPRDTEKAHYLSSLKFTTSTGTASPGDAVRETLLDINALYKLSSPL